MNKGKKLNVNKPKHGLRYGNKHRIAYNSKIDTQIRLVNKVL